MAGGRREKKTGFIQHSSSKRNIKYRGSHDSAEEFKMAAGPNVPCVTVTPWNGKQYVTSSIMDVYALGCCGAAMAFIIANCNYQ